MEFPFALCSSSGTLMRERPRRRQRSPARTATDPDIMYSPVATTEAVPDDASSRAADVAVAALPSAPPGRLPRPKLRTLAFTGRFLRAVFYVNVPCLVVLLITGDLWLGPTLSSVILAISFIEAALYMLVLALSMSKSAQGWITFGHPAKVIGAANSGGAFDRGARLLGVRDYNCPADVGLPHARPVRIPVTQGSGSEGSVLGAWHVLPSARARDVLEEIDDGAPVDRTFDKALRYTASSLDDEAAPLAAIYLHGNFESRSKWVSVEHARMLSAHFGLHVMTFDYRGFADSTGGPPTSQSLGEDGHSVAQWLAARGVPPARVVLYGHSLGSGAAAQLALRLQASGTPPFAIVLEAPFYSLRAAALTFPAALPLLALPGAGALVLRAFMNGCRSADALATLPTLPVLILHGDEDTTVPIQHAVALWRHVQAVRNGQAAPCHLEVLDGCDHLQVLLHTRTIALLSAFLREVQAAQARAACV